MKNFFLFSFSFISSINKWCKPITNYFYVYVKDYFTKRGIRRWNFSRPFSELLKLAEYNHNCVNSVSKQITRRDKTNPKGHALAQACYLIHPTEGHYDVGLHSLSIGTELVQKGKLKQARDFFLALHKIFPDIYEPYVLLYDLIYLRQEAYRAAPEQRRAGQLKPLILSFSIWGESYIRLFCNYCIPTLMAEGNLPAVSKLRNISVDICAHSADIEIIKHQEVVKTLSEICTIHFVEFPESLVTCEGYKRNDFNFRYNIYGGFHHLSIERARSIGADVMCLGPDNIYSNGSFLYYVQCIDNGFTAVLFNATRAQAEFLIPLLDTMKDPDSGALTINSDEMVYFSTQFIHHSFMQYVVSDIQMPIWRSAFYIPYTHGLYIRGYHLHPVIIAAAAIDRSKDIRWNYMTVDADLTTTIFSDPNSVKVITDSRDGIMLDIAYGSLGMHDQVNMEFSEDYLDKTRAHFNELHLWNFQFKVNYRMEKPIHSVRCYLYDENGVLQSKEFPLNTTIEDILKRTDRWLTDVNKGARTSLH
jgi:hypothetical protein